MLRDNQQFNESIKPNSAFLDELRQKMPEFFTATKYDEEGNVVESSTFDNEKFQQALKEQNIDELSSGYRLDFIGKNYAKKQAGERPTTVIVPDNDHNQKEENKNSKNLFFTGDNLEVLRHLQQNYANSVDFIYIDPPYNTGSDGFVYPDNFEYSDNQLKDMFGLNDDELKRLKSIQGKATHSAWLTFMYPRLYLAKKVLKDTGVIFISIDDNEQANLKLQMDDVFGEGSFVDIFTRVTKRGGKSSDATAKNHDFVIAYAKNISQLDLVGVLHNDGNYKNQDEYFEERGFYKLNQTLDYDSLGYSKSLDYPIEIDGTTFYAGGSEEQYNKRKSGAHDRADWAWRWSKDLFEFGLKKGFIELRTGGLRPRIYTKTYQNVKIEKRGEKYEVVKIDRTKPLSTLEFTENMFSNDIATTQVSSLIGKGIFEYTKPTSLIKRLMELKQEKDLIVFDFFAGSSTTADAVMQLNAEDGGNRQFIMCTLPEPTFTVNSDGKEIPTKGGEAAYKEGYKSIDEISRARIIRAATKIKLENKNLPNDFDGGFKHYRVVPPTQDTLEKIDYDDHLQLDLFDDMIDVFSSKKLGVAGNADGFDTIFHTYLAQDNYQFDVPIKLIDFTGIQLPYVNNQRIYLIAKNWQAENTRALVNAIGKNELLVQTIVVYGYTLEMESLRELEIALNQLENKVNLQVRY